jgi:hypothetical protein
VEWIAFAAAAVVVGVWMWRRRPGSPMPDTPEEFLTAAARADEGPGALFGEAGGVRFPGPRARAWAYGVLYEAGVDADADPSYAAGLLMRAQTQLTRAHADALVRAML